MATEGQEVNQSPPIDTLNVEQLRALSKQIQESIQVLTKNSYQLESAVAKYKESKKAVNALKEAKEGDGLMAPLTTSMYVKAKIKDTKRVTVELGTGYYVKKSVDKADEFFKRKINFVEDSLEKIEKQILVARNNLERVIAMTNHRIQQQAQAPRA